MNLTYSNIDAIKNAVSRRLERMKVVFTESIELEKEQIKSRTISGIGASDKQLSPSKYSRRWAKERQKYGLQTAYVDLKFTGAMLNAIRVAYTKKGDVIVGTIFFDTNDASNKARWNERFPGRKFFALSKRQQQSIRTKLRQVQ